MKIKKEFKERLWALTKDEYENLEKDIIENGCREKLLTWNEYLIDGHNRYEICSKHNIEYETIEKDFETEQDVLYWIDSNQLSRRNLLDWQRTIIEGRLSKLHKQDRFIHKSVGQNVSRSQQIISEKLGKSTKTLQRAEKYVDAYDSMTIEIGKDNTDKLASTLSKDEFVKVEKLNTHDKEKIIEKSNSGKKYKSGTSIIKEVAKEKHIEERNEKQKELPKSIKTFNDDCRNILNKIKDDSIDMVLTDPPYGIDFVSSWKSSEKQSFQDDKDTIIPLLHDVCKLLQQKCKQDAHLYFFSSWMSFSYFENVISKYFDISNVIIWEKNNTSLVDFDKRYGFSYEQVFFCKQKGNNDRLLNNKSSRDVVKFNRISRPDHTCEKPVDLLEYFINNSTIEKELVVDCFAGTFNSGLASKNLNRNYIGIEKDTDFYKKGIDKL